MAREILRTMKTGSMSKRKENGEKGNKLSLRIIERMIAKIRLAPGPANDIRAESLWGFLRL